MNTAILSNLAQPTNNTTSFMPTCATISMSTLGGTILGGPVGGLVGFVTSTLDEYFISNKKMEKHYLSTSAFWLTTTVAPLFNLALQYTPYGMGSVAATAVAVTGLALPYITDDFLNFKEKLETPIDAFFGINKMFDDRNIFSYDEAKRISDTFSANPLKALSLIKEDAYELSQNPFFMSFIKNTGLGLLKASSKVLFLHLLGSYASNLFIYNLLNNNQGHQLSDLNTLSPYLKEAFKILALLSIQNEVEFQIEAKENEVALDQYEIVLEKSTELLIHNGNGRRILAEDGGKELVQNLTPDLTKLIYRGASRINRVMSGSFQTLSSLLMINWVAPNAIAPYALLSLLHQKYLQYLSTNIKSLFKKHTEGEVSLWDIKFDIANNIDQINLRGGEAFATHQYNEILSKQNSLQKQMEYFEKLKEGSSKRSALLAQSIDVFHYALLALQPGFQMGKIPLLKQSVDDVYTFLSGNINLQMTSKELNLAKERLDKIFKIIGSPNPSTLERSRNSKGTITIDDYTLNLKGISLLKVGHFEFKPGKRYAITGKSGCGKSSFLIDIKQGVLGALSSAGKISIGSTKEKKADIMFIDQDLYMPVDSTLLETVGFPKVLSKQSPEEIALLKERVISLFRELEIDRHAEDEKSSEGLISLLDSQEFKLSGGQKKKIAVIQAILQKPDILIKDETFTGLDKESLILVQKAILKYLPEAMILSIDHHAEDNNYDGFYESNVHFSKGDDGIGKIEEEPIAVK